jgi:hypothetical protein
VNGAEILHGIEILTRVEEANRAPRSTINPEVLAMHKGLPLLDPRWQKFVRRRMAFDIEHFSERRIHKSELGQWRAIQEEVKDVLPTVPKDIGSLPSGWRRVFSEVMRLYGDPHKA